MTLDRAAAGAVQNGPACPGDGDCCANNGTPGCDDVDCCDCVCAIDSFCCDVGWDISCAAPACESCASVCDCCSGDPVCGDGVVEPPEECETDADCAGDLACFNCICVPPIPTVSEWGMIALTVLLLAAGGVFVTRRRAAVTPQT